MDSSKELAGCTNVMHDLLFTRRLSVHFNSPNNIEMLSQPEVVLFKAVRLLRFSLLLLLSLVFLPESSII